MTKGPDFTIKSAQNELHVLTWPLAECYAIEEAQAYGESRVEVRYPHGGGYIIKFTGTAFGAEKEYLPRDWEV